MRPTGARVVVVVMVRVLVVAVAVLVLRVVVVLVAAVLVMLVVVLVSTLRRCGPLRHAELDRADAGPVHALARDRHAVEPERPDYPLQLVERRAGVEQRAEEHVAGHAGEAVEVEDLCHPESPGRSGAGSATAARSP